MDGCDAPMSGGPPRSIAQPVAPLGGHFRQGPPPGASAAGRRTGHYAPGRLREGVTRDVPRMGTARPVHVPVGAAMPLWRSCVVRVLLIRDSHPAPWGAYLPVHAPTPRQGLPRL